MGHGNSNIFLSTEQIEPAFRNVFWRAVLRPIFDVLPSEAAGQLSGSILVRPIGGLTIASVSFNRQRHVRNSITIASTELDHYLLHLVVAGTMQAQCDRIGISAEPGDICLFDLSRAYTSDAEAGRRISLAIPRERIDRAAGGRDIHGLMLRSDAPLTRLLGRMILDLHHGAGELDAAGSAAETAIVDFIAAIVAGEAIKLASGESSPAGNLRQNMLRFIDAHLEDPDLGPALIMRQFQISRAHLYRAFAADGGVATVIRNKRLDSAYRRLKSGDDRSRSITEVAYEMGFASSGQFSRAFKARFGLSPREVRAGNDASNAASRGASLLQCHFEWQAKCWAAQNERGAEPSFGPPAERIYPVLDNAAGF